MLPTLSADWVERYHPIVRPSDRAVSVKGLRIAGVKSMMEYVSAVINMLAAETFNRDA